MRNAVIFSIVLAISVAGAMPATAAKPESAAVLSLRRLDELPDLLPIARIRSQSSRRPLADVEDELARECVQAHRPYHWSLPKGAIITCSTGKHTFTETRHRFVIPSRKHHGRPLQVTILESELHEIREHGAPVPAPLQSFIASLPSK